MATEELLAGSLEGAALFYGRGLAMTREIGYWHGSGHGLMGCAVLAGLSGNAAQGARLHGSVMVHVPVLRRGIPPAYFALYDQMIGEVRSSLSPTEFDRHMFFGTRLAWDDAIDEAQSFTTELVQQSASGIRARLVARPVRQPSARPVTGEDQVAEGTVSALTKRELEVLGLIAAGESNKDIARLIGVSPKTVMHHSVSIYRKLAVRGRAEATAIAIQRGLVSGTQETVPARPAPPHLA
jgi:DNA-binding CsgD family transcriptional regulator